MPLSICLSILPPSPALSCYAPLQLLLYAHTLTLILTPQGSFDSLDSLNSLDSLDSLDSSYSLPRFIVSYIIFFEFRTSQEFRIHGIRTLLFANENLRLGIFHACDCIKLVNVYRISHTRATIKVVS
jgi:hypothetical protein